MFVRLCLLNRNRFGETERIRGERGKCQNLVSRSHIDLCTCAVEDLDQGVSDACVSTRHNEYCAILRGD